MSLSASASSTISQPAKQRDPYGVKISQTNTNQEVIQIPYVSGRVKLPAMWVSRPYGTRVVSITERHGSGGKGGGSTTSTVGHKYYSNLIGILCIGPVDVIKEIVINNSIVWQGSIFRSNSPDFAQIGLPSDDGQVRIYWGTGSDPVPSWFDTEGEYHPGYTWRCRIELLQLLYGAQDTTQVPNVEVVLERRPLTPPVFTSVLPDGVNALFKSDFGVSPFGCIYEWMFHPVLGAGLADATDTVNWIAAIYDCAVTGIWINPKVDTAETFKSLIQKALDYFDGWLRRAPNGLIQIGRFRHVDVQPVVFLNDTDFLIEPKISTKMLEDTINQAIVKFVNQYNYFKDDAAIFNDFGNQLIQGFVRFVTYDRPWIAHPGLAFYHAYFMGTLYANPIISGKVSVSKELVSGANPGDIIQIAATTYNMQGLFRLKAKTLSEATKWICDLDVEQERGTWTYAYSLDAPTYPSRPDILALDITNARIVELPAGLGKSTTGIVIAILAARNDSLMLGFTPWFTRDPIGSQVYDHINVQSGFAIWGRLQQHYGQTPVVDTFEGLWIITGDIDLVELISKSDLERDNFEWLIFLNKEIMSMGQVIPLGNNQFRIYTRRACYGTVQPVFHNALDNAWFVARSRMGVLSHPSWKIGDTWYFKMQGFNQTNTFDLSLSSIFAYTFKGDSGGGGLNGPTNLIVGTNGNAVLFSWKDDTSGLAVGYEIRYGAIGGTWFKAKIAATKVPSAGSVQLTNIPPNVWTFYVASMDMFGTYSAPVSYDLNIPAYTYILAEKNYGPVNHALDIGVASTPDWDTGNGTIFTNCLVHPTAYALLPQDTQAANYVPPGGTGFELFDNFVNGWPSTCTVELPVLDSLGSGTSVRSSEVVTEYLIGLENQPVTGEDFIIVFNPLWENATIANGVLHPTAYCIIPTTIHNASYVPPGGTGFELFDQFIFDVQAKTTISYIQDVNAPYPWYATLDANYKPGYSNAVVAAKLSISWSSDLVTWTQLISGPNALYTNYVARYAQFKLVLNNLPPLDLVVTLPPSWDNTIITNGVVHPTAYCVMPTTIHNASYTGGGTGFEIFDQFVFDVQTSTTIDYVKDLTNQFPWSSTINATYAPGYANGAISETLSISWSNDNSTWTTLVSGTGASSTNFTSRYVRLRIVLDNTSPVGFVKTLSGELISVYAPSVQNVGFVNAMSGEIVAGSSKYWTSIFAQIKTSQDNIVFTSVWDEVASTFVSDRYIKPRISWNPTSGLWPISVSSLWILLDANQLSQGDFFIAIPAGGATIHYPVPYRQKVSVTVTAVSGTSAYAVVTSYTLATFTVQIFNAGSAIAGNINWNSIGA